MRLRALSDHPVSVVRRPFVERLSHGYLGQMEPPALCSVVSEYHGYHYVFVVQLGQAAKTASTGVLRRCAPNTLSHLPTLR